MRIPVKPFWRVSALFLLAGMFSLVIPTPPAQAADVAQDKGLELQVPSWLILGPFEEASPAFADDPKYGFDAASLLEFNEFDFGSVRPKAGLAGRLTEAGPAIWKELPAGEAGVSLSAGGAQAKTAYLTARVESFQYRKARLTVRTRQLHRVFFDGRQVAARTRAAIGEETTSDLKIETGVHQILIKTVYDPKSQADWNVRVSLLFSEARMKPDPRISAAAAEKVSLRHVLDGPQAAGVSVSPDGTCAALTMTRTLPPSDESESWIQLYQIEAGSGGLSARPARSLRGTASVADLVWAPEGKRFSYTTHDKNGGSIWLADAATGETRLLLRDYQNLGSHAWAPDGNTIVFSASEDGPKDSGLAKRHRDLEDRQPGRRDRRHLFRISLPDSRRERLTAGEFSADFSGFSPDGKSLLFTRTLIDMADRSFFKTELYRLDLSSFKEDLLWKGSWFNGARFSPDGKSLLILGGPSAFGDAGRNVSAGRIPNDYDIQAYLFDLAGRGVRSITRDFPPSIDQVFWNGDGQIIRFLATDGSRRRLYEYRLADGVFNRLDAGLDYIHALDIARRAPVAALIASSSDAMPRILLWDLRKKHVRPLTKPGPEAEAELVLGKVETWTFKSRRGAAIDGFVVYPPDFDPNRTYPLIVNYYGGTSPVERYFGGRYPHALYAAQGYIVYVPEPSGATGYGQEFSAVHVNDWGEIAAEEIIDGVTAFLAAHPCVDAKRVGCIGASYGGFMTMTLATKTPLFAAAISHAGISSLSGYWGEGYWGYSYSAVATAGSFPWNRKEIYVDRSPLYNADKINTPLLLLHGESDTNVPPGESFRMFTALKILGRETELITFPGEDHRILTYNKRILFNKTILAWFDRWLKGQLDWWNDLYPQ